MRLTRRLYRTDNFFSSTETTVTIFAILNGVGGGLRFPPIFNVQK